MASFATAAAGAAAGRFALQLMNNGIQYVGALAEPQVHDWVSSKTESWGSAGQQAVGTVFTAAEKKFKTQGH